ncbi:MAG TPA: S41 family peptidase [Rudaea sp.]|jgi:tricorn protease|nr:S41 family peptidase [Rudaea sp.]
MSIRNLCARFAVALALFGVASFAAAQTKLLRFPDICNDRIVFTYGGDLWTVSAQGGTAIRLTAGPGLQESARFSPDCSQIAFTGEYSGEDQVYMMPANGGVPTQLTFYPAQGPLPQRWGFDNQVYGWTPDGNRVLFRGYMDTFALAQPRLFTVSKDGGLPEALPMTFSGVGAYSPDGKQLVYSPLFRDFRTWNRYQGGWAEDLYIFDIATQQGRNITNNPRSDRDPIWIGNAIYFVSDRDDVLNLYKYDIGTSQTTQLTKHRNFDARWASGDRAGHIVYELGGELHVYDANSNQDRAVSIAVPTDGARTRAEHIAVADKIEQSGLSPHGERAFFVARGDLFTAPVEHGITRNLTQTPGAHEREAAWAPDGKHIAYVSDASGDEAIWVRDTEGNSPKQLTHEVLGRLYAPHWSPDGKRIAFSDSANRIEVIDAAGGKVIQIARDGFGLQRDYVWSPKGSYLAYTVNEDNAQPSVFVWSVVDGKSTRVTDPIFAESNPAFSPDGKFLYFLGAREWAPQISGIEFNFATNRNVGIYALTLQKNGPSPFPVQNDEAKAATEESAVDEDDKTKKEKKKENDTESKKEKAVDAIDFDGLASRVTRAPIDADNIQTLNITGKFIVYTVGDAFYYGRDGKFKPQVHVYDLKKRKDKTLVENVDSAALSDDGEKLLVQAGDSYKVYDVDGDGKDSKSVSTSGLALMRDPHQEYAEIFREVWRRYRDYFYVANMNGYDWNALRAKYEPLLQYVGDRSDLNYLLGQMVGELSNSHSYVTGGDLKLPKKPHVALLGAHFELDRSTGRYRIKDIMQGENDEDRYRSPLTEVGVNVHVGDYVLAINGQDLTAHDNPYRLLQIAPGQPVELRVNSKPTDAGARNVLVKPIDTEEQLKYYAWVEHNRRYVDQQSHGKLGYIYIPDMGGDGIREFIKWYYPQIRKEGLVVDVRDNGGGNVSSMIIERLARKLLGVNFGRNATETGTYPGQVFIGYMAALINESTASDGDIFSYMFKQAKLGPTIGKRTWGGIVGINDYGPLLDGGQVEVPEFVSIADLNGNYKVEGEGVSPDIEVDNDVLSTIHGKDPQLDRAIAEIMKKVDENPPRLPQRQADPVKAPVDMRPKSQ